MTELALNGHALGIIMRELVRRAMAVGQRYKLAMEVSDKPSYGGDKPDFFTIADTTAQEVYVKSLQECCPDYGIIGEENELNIEAKNGARAYFTLDPIDGTKAYIRRQSHGVGTMIALVVDGEIVSAYIGDINTGEIFGYRPGSSKVWRISSYDVTERLLPTPAEPGVEKRHIMMRERESIHKKGISLQTIDQFNGVVIDGGSIGIWAARLWKNEVGALLLPPSFETPWDSTPVIGISQRLDYAFLRSHEDSWVVFEPRAPTEKYYREDDILIINRSLLPSLADKVKIIRE